MKKYSLLIIPLAFILLVGCSSQEQQPTESPSVAVDTPMPTDTPVPEIVGDPDIGQAIFESGGSNENYKPSNYCSNCHTLDGSEDDGPSLQGISTRAGERIPGLSAADYIRQSILEPREYVVDGFNAMGSISSALLSEEELDHVIAFLMTQ